ncbi:MAG: CotY/CotZ family spore coat protein [Bacilli bacterium]
MCNNENNSCENCIADILKVILLLQQSVCQGDCCLETCDKGFLGQNSCLFFNTRPIVLYTCGSGNTPLAMPISKSPTETETSTVFRLEKLDGCCATFRVLAPNTDTTSTFPFEATNSFFTINLGCCCILRCLDDTFVDCM